MLPGIRWGLKGGGLGAPNGSSSSSSFWGVPALSASSSLCPGAVSAGLAPVGRNPMDPRIPEEIQRLLEGDKSLLVPTPFLPRKGKSAVGWSWEGFGVLGCGGTSLSPTPRRVQGLWLHIPELLGPGKLPGGPKVGNVEGFAVGLK